MRVYLIRHGETVDNVAQLYSGSRDCALTNHGFQQAKLLGQHLHGLGVRFNHVFSSDLQRAAITARQLIKPHAEQDEITHLQLALIREQDFGSYEGLSYVPGHAISGGLASDGVDVNSPDHVPIESMSSLEARVDRFLTDYLISAVHETQLLDDRSVAVVAHGITLSVMWRRLLARLPPSAVAFHQDLISAGTVSRVDRIGGWGNTGYLELDIVPGPETVARSLTGPALVASDEVAERGATDSLASSVRKHEATEVIQLVTDTAVVVQQDPEKPESSVLTFEGWTATILTVNGRDHLVGLKRTRGGVGSARYDENQKTLDSFFEKKQKGNDGSL